MALPYVMQQFNTSKHTTFSIPGTPMVISHEDPVYSGGQTHVWLVGWQVPLFRHTVRSHKTGGGGPLEGTRQEEGQHTWDAIGMIVAVDSAAESDAHMVCTYVACRPFTSNHLFHCSVRNVLLCSLASRHNSHSQHQSNLHSSRSRGNLEMCREIHMPHTCIITTILYTK